MDSKDLAARLREQLAPEERWWDGRHDSYQNGKMCLGMALQRVLQQETPGVFDWEGAYGAYRHYQHLILGIVARLFPDRARYSIPGFNDHGTSYEDVMLVIKHLEDEP